MKTLADFDTKKIKLIAFDLDGTLLDPASHVTAETKEALEKAAAAGYSLAAATGRVYTSLPKDLFEIEGLRYVITSNGAHVVDLKTGETLYSRLIDPACLQAALPVIFSRDLLVEIFYQHRGYFDQHCLDDLAFYGVDTPARREYTRTTRTAVPDIRSLLEEHKAELENVMIMFADPAVKQEYFDALKDLPGLNVVYSSHLSLEIGGSESTKANALAFLQQKLGLEPDSLMAFGDSTNDLSMLEYAYMGIAMGNSVQYLKDRADLIGPTNAENGVALMIRTLMALNGEL